MLNKMAQKKEYATNTQNVETSKLRISNVNLKLSLLENLFERITFLIYSGLDPLILVITSQATKWLNVQ